VCVSVMVKYAQPYYAYLFANFICIIYEDTYWQRPLVASYALKVKRRQVDTSGLTLGVMETVKRPPNTKR